MLAALWKQNLFCWQLPNIFSDYHREPIQRYKLIPFNTHLWLVVLASNCTASHWHLCWKVKSEVELEKLKLKFNWWKMSKISRNQLLLLHTNSLINALPPTITWPGITCDVMWFISIGFISWALHGQVESSFIHVYISFSGVVSNWCDSFMSYWMSHTVQCTNS